MHWPVYWVHNRFKKIKSLFAKPASSATVIGRDYWSIRMRNAPLYVGVTHHHNDHWYKIKVCTHVNPCFFCWASIPTGHGRVSVCNALVSVQAVEVPVLRDSREGKCAKNNVNVNNWVLGHRSKLKAWNFDFHTSIIALEFDREGEGRGVWLFITPLFRRRSKIVALVVQSRKRLQPPFDGTLWRGPSGVQLEAKQRERTRIL